MKNIKIIKKFLTKENYERVTEARSYTPRYGARITKKGNIGNKRSKGTYVKRGPRWDAKEPLIPIKKARRDGTMVTYYINPAKVDFNVILTRGFGDKNQIRGAFEHFVHRYEGKFTRRNRDEKFQAIFGDNWTNYHTWASGLEGYFSNFLHSGANYKERQAAKIRGSAIYGNKEVIEFDLPGERNIGILSTKFNLGKIEKGENPNQIKASFSYDSQYVQHIGDKFELKREEKINNYTGTYRVAGDIIVDNSGREPHRVMNINEFQGYNAHMLTEMAANVGSHIHRINLNGNQNFFSKSDREWEERTLLAMSGWQFEGDDAKNFNRFKATKEFKEIMSKIDPELRYTKYDQSTYLGKQEDNFLMFMTARLKDYNLLNEETNPAKNKHLKELVKAYSKFLGTKNMYTESGGLVREPTIHDAARHSFLTQFDQENRPLGFKHQVPGLAEAKRREPSYKGGSGLSKLGKNIAVRLNVIKPSELRHELDVKIGKKYIDKKTGKVRIKRATPRKKRR